MRRTLSIAMSFAMLAGLALAAPTSAGTDYDNYGKGEAALYDASSSRPTYCGGATDTGGSTFGKIKVNVKDGLVKFDVKVEGATSDTTWTVLLYQDKYWGGCGNRSIATYAGGLTTDAWGKGGLKDEIAYTCGVNRIWATVHDPANPRTNVLASTSVELPYSYGYC